MDLAAFSALPEFEYAGFATATTSDEPISASTWMPHPGREIHNNLMLASRPALSEGDGPATGLTSPTQSQKRNASVAGFDSSPASASIGSPDLNDEHARVDGKRRPVKRACNECRQQKVSYENCPGASSRGIDLLLQFRLLLSLRPRLGRGTLCWVTFLSLLLPNSVTDKVLATMQCRPRALPDLLTMQATQPRL